MDSYVPDATPWKPDFKPADASPYFIKHNPVLVVLVDPARARSAGAASRTRRRCSPTCSTANSRSTRGSRRTSGTTATGSTAPTTSPKPRAPLLVDQHARWLERFFDRLRFPGPHSHLPPNTLVVVTFDESDFENDYQPDLASTYDGPNQIYTVLLADSVEPAFEEEGYNHYSLLRTIEVNFGLDHLGKNDAGANWFQFLWGRRFAWGPPQATTASERRRRPAGGRRLRRRAVRRAAPAPTARSACAPGSIRRAWPLVGGRDAGGRRRRRHRDGLDLRRARAGRPLGTDGDGSSCLKYDLHAGWQVDAAPRGHPGRAVRARLVRRVSRRIMLAIARRRRQRDVVRPRRAGPMRRGARRARAGRPAPAARSRSAALGESVYLIVKSAVTTQSMQRGLLQHRAVQRRVGGAEQVRRTVGQHRRRRLVAERVPRGALLVAPRHVPPASAVRRAVHRRRPDGRGDARRRAASRPSGPGHPAAAHRDLLDLRRDDARTTGVVQERCSKTDNNGFGTFAEGGWSHQSPMFGSECPPGAPLACARSGDELVVLYRSTPGGTVDIRTGRYLADSSESRDPA